MTTIRVPVVICGGTAVRTPFDCAVVATNHRVFDAPRLAQMPLIVDTRNALRDCAGAHIFRL